MVEYIQRVQEDEDLLQTNKCQRDLRRMASRNDLDYLRLSFKDMMGESEVIAFRNGVMVTSNPTIFRLDPNRRVSDQLTREMVVGKFEYVTGHTPGCIEGEGKNPLDPTVYYKSPRSPLPYKLDRFE